MLFTFFFILHSNVCRHGIETLPGHYTFPSSRMDARRSRSCPWIVVMRDTMQNQLARKFEHGESHESRSKELGEKLGRIRSEFRNARVSEVTCQSPWQRHLVSHDQNPQQFGKTTSTARSYDTLLQRIFIDQFVAIIFIIPVRRYWCIRQIREFQN